jgi:hypothetical protein
LGSGNGQIPEESDLPCLKRMTIFRAAEIGVEQPERDGPEEEDIGVEDRASASR